MPNLSGRKIITNRQLNFTLSPVDTHNKKEMPYRLQNYEIDGKWNQHQSIILDCILNRIFNGMYRQYKKIPQSWRSKKTIDVINTYSNDMITPWTLTVLSKPLYDAYIVRIGKDVFGEIKENFRKSRRESKLSEGITNFKQYLNYWHSYKTSEYRQFKNDYNAIRNNLNSDLEYNFVKKNLFEAYPFLKRYKYTLEEQLAKVASTRFKMNYKVKYMEKLPVFDEDGKVTERGRLIDIYYEMKDFQHIFKVAFDDDIIKFNFETPLGKLIVYNMLIMDTDWMPLDVLNLNKNAYFLYKRFVLNKRAAKFKPSKIELKFEDIKAFLDISWKNDRGVHAMILKSINDMKVNGLIDNFVWNKNIANRRVYELHFEDKKKKPKKPKDATGKGLKMTA